MDCRFAVGWYINEKDFLKEKKTVKQFKIPFYLSVLAIHAKVHA